MDDLFRIVIALGATGSLGCIYWFILDPLWCMMKRFYRWITFKPDPIRPPTPPSPKVPEPYRHWYLHDVLEVDQRDMELMAPKDWSGRGFVPPPPGPHQVGYTVNKYSMGTE